MDTINAGPGADLILWDPDDAAVSGGTGTDTLSVRDSDLDLAAFGGTIDGIEVVDMSNGEASTTVLDVSDVLDLSDTDVLTVLGDADDSLDAGAGWTGGDVNAEQLEVFTQDFSGTLATLLVEPDVQTNPDLVA